MTRHSRRTFLTQAGWGALGLAVLGGATGAVGFLSQRTAIFTQFTDIVPLKYLSSTAPAFVNEEAQVRVTLDSDGIQATSAICTFDGCSMGRFEVGRFGFLRAVCPCCGSVFMPSGWLMRGPATKPLPFYALYLSREGILQVDLEQNDPADEYVKQSGSGISNELYFKPEQNKMIHIPFIPREVR